MRNDDVNKIVIRLHRELDEASRTLGKVRRFGVPAAKAKLVTACRQRLVSIVSELVTLEQSYAEVTVAKDNRTTHGTELETKGLPEATVGVGEQGLVEGSSSEGSGETNPVAADPQ